MNMIRNMVWNSLTDYYFKASVMGYAIQRFQKIDRCINIILALASSGSIAAWAIWKEIPYVWGAIIALSQVIQTVKPYFPYSRYIRELNEKSKKLQAINLRFEMLFYEIDYGAAQEEELSTKYFALRKEAEEICFFNADSSFSFTDGDEQKANQDTAHYLKQNYNVEYKK